MPLVPDQGDAVGLENRLKDVGHRRRLHRSARLHRHRPGDLVADDIVGLQDIAEYGLCRLRDRCIEQIDRYAIGPFEGLGGNDGVARADELTATAADKLRLSRGSVRGRRDKAVPHRARRRTRRAVARIAASRASVRPHAVEKLRRCARRKGHSTCYGKMPKSPFDTQDTTPRPRHSDKRHPVESDVKNHFDVLSE